MAIPCMTGTSLVVSINIYLSAILKESPIIINWKIGGILHLTAQWILGQMCQTSNRMSWLARSVPRTERDKQKRSLMCCILWCLYALNCNWMWILFDLTIITKDPPQEGGNIKKDWTIVGRIMLLSAVKMLKWLSYYMWNNCNSY